MSKYEQYAALTATKANDLLLAVDVNDTSMSPQGTTKKVSLAALGNNIQTKTANYTVTTSDYILFGDTSLGNVTFTLPDATTCPGQAFIFKIINAANTVFFATVGGQTIDGMSAGSWALGATNFSGFELVSNGSNWDLIGSNGMANQLAVLGLFAAQGGIQLSNITTVTSNTTLTTGGYIVLCNGASGAIALTLPDASTCKGQVYLIKIVNAANATTLTPQAGQTVNGFASYFMNHTGWTAYIVSDGVSNWNVFGAFGFTDNNILDDSAGDANFSGNVVVQNTLELNGGATIKFGSTLDTDLYRLAANSLATDGALTVFGIAALSGGTDTSGAAGVFTPTPTSGTAFQPSTQSDCTLYCNIKIASTFSLSIGSTSAASSTIVASGTAGVGLVTVRVPKNWWVKSTFTAADVAWSANRC